MRRRAWQGGESTARRGECTEGEKELLGGESAVRRRGELRRGKYCDEESTARREENCKEGRAC